MKEMTESDGKEINVSIREKVEQFAFVTRWKDEPERCAEHKRRKQQEG